MRRHVLLLLLAMIIITLSSCVTSREGSKLELPQSRGYILYGSDSPEYHTEGSSIGSYYSMYELDSYISDKDLEISWGLDASYKIEKDVPYPVLAMIDVDGKKYKYVSVVKNKRIPGLMEDSESGIIIDEENKILNAAIAYKESTSDPVMFRTAKNAEGGIGYELKPTKALYKSYGGYVLYFQSMKKEGPTLKVMEYDERNKKQFKELYQCKFYGKEQNLVSYVDAVMKVIDYDYLEENATIQILSYPRYPVSSYEFDYYFWQ